MQKEVGKVYKLLLAQQTLLGVKMGDVRSSISFAVLPHTILAAALKQALFSTITSRGWVLVKDSILLDCSVGDLQPGVLQDCRALQDLEVVVNNSRTATFVMRAGTFSHSVFEY